MISAGPPSSPRQADKQPILSAFLPSPSEMRTSGGIESVEGAAEDPRADRLYLLVERVDLLPVLLHLFLGHRGGLALDRVQGQHMYWGHGVPPVAEASRS